MARLTHLFITIALLSTTALSSPLAVPQRGRPFRNWPERHADHVFSVPSATESIMDVKTYVYGSGNRRATDVVTTTYTTILYTTLAVTEFLSTTSTLPTSASAAQTSAMTTAETTSSSLAFSNSSSTTGSNGTTSAFPLSSASNATGATSSPTTILSLPTISSLANSSSTRNSSGPQLTGVSASPAASTSTSGTSLVPLAPSATSSSASQVSSAAASASSTPAPSDVYRSYNGDGTASDGWPTPEEWISFDSMFDANRPNIEISCAQWNVPLNSDDEIATMRDQILSIGQETNVDPRFILAMIIQESAGCVRVITTAYSHANPGLMQSFNGTGSCNTSPAAIGIPGVTPGEVQTPCPESEIRQQILDGTNGTVWGPGLVQDLAEQGREDSSRWYRAARLYNGGSIVEGNLALPCCTASYASDIANRLMGWVNAARTFVAEQ